MVGNSKIKGASGQEAIYRPQILGMNKLTDKTMLSLLAFNGSKNCDHDSPESFYNSYISRKAVLIKGRLFAAENGDKNVNKKKLLEDMAYIREVKESKVAVLDFIKKLEERKLDAKTIKEAGDLLGGLNLR